MEFLLREMDKKGRRIGPAGREKKSKPRAQAAR